MNVVVKKGFKLISSHIISMVVALFLVFVFGWAIEKWGFFPFSVVTTLIYVGIFYSEGWNWGRLEGRPYNEIKETPLRALIASIMLSIIPIVFAVLIFLDVGSPLTHIIAKIWYFPFVGLFQNQDSISVKEILLSGATVPIFVTAGYFVGTKNFSVLESFAYRKNKIKEEEARKARKHENYKN